MSLDCVNLVTKSGDGKGGIKLSHAPAHLVPGNVRKCKGDVAGSGSERVLCYRRSE